MKTSFFGVVALGLMVFLCTGWTIQGADAEVGALCSAEKSCHSGEKCGKKKEMPESKCFKEADCKSEDGCEITNPADPAGEKVKKCYTGVKCEGGTTGCAEVKPESKDCPAGSDACTTITGKHGEVTVTTYACNTKAACEALKDTCKSCATEDCNKPGEGSGGHKSAQGLGLVMMTIMVAVTFFSSVVIVGW